MQLKFYPILQTNSKRALANRKTKYGRDKKYSPKITLIKRLALQFQMTEQQVYFQLLQERKFLLDND